MHDFLLGLVYFFLLAGALFAFVGFTIWAVSWWTEILDR